MANPNDPRFATVDFTNRRFGVEIEVERCPQHVAQRALEDAGLVARVESYNHATRGHWKVTTDGSLASYATCSEVVSPILSGEAGLAAVALAIEALRAAGAVVNERTGLHVHVEISDMTPKQAGHVVALYAQNEDALDLCLAPRRRTNAFARSLFSSTYVTTPEAIRERQNAVIAAHRRIRSDRALRDSQTASRDRRYHKVSLAPIERGQPTVEFRAKEGTLDSIEVTAWVTLCVALVERARKLRSIRALSHKQGVARQWHYLRAAYFTPRVQAAMDTLRKRCEAKS